MASKNAKQVFSSGELRGRSARMQGLDSTQHRESKQANTEAEQTATSTEVP